MSSSPTKSNSNSIFYFPAFIDTNNNQENNYEQNGGFLGILSNLFRPSKSSSTTETVFSEGVCIAKSDEKDVVFEDSVEEPFNEQQPSTSNTSSNFFNSRKNELRRYWMPDSSGNECYECHTQTERQLIEMFDNKLNKLLDTLLIREQLGHSMWKDLLWKLSKLVADKIFPVALNNASTNFPLEFLHIKKLHIDSDPDYEIIDGIAFTKSLAHTSMPTSMEKISLILLNGMISYERVLEKFSSIESLMQQEEKFLHLQCDRIMSVDVNMLITENAIPVAVLDLLTKKGISVLANVK
uniref:Uncharacterized protein n=1 Tax=Meloidogyne javanica TaxID=6303 RepID=A0A915MEU6_MELJA